MTGEEATKYLIQPVRTSTELGEEKKKEFEAYNMAKEALSTNRTWEWIEHDPKTEGLAKIYECPFCGDEVIGEKTNFCPNCGAKMDKGGDTE